MASLGNDLADIRKERNLTLEDIHEATKIPEHILKSIEDDSIFTDFEENPTYIRSYVRSYAKALSIDEEQIVYALNKKEKEDYKGSLRQLLQAGEVEAFEPEEEVGEEPKPPAEEQEMEKETEKELSKEEEKSTPPEAEAPITESPSVQSVDWADMGKRFQPLESTKSRIWIGIFILVLIVAAGTYLYMYQSDQAEPGALQGTSQSEQQASTGTQDSLQLNIVPPVEDENTGKQDSITEGMQAPQKALQALPDTLTMLVYAAYGKLEPVRVYTDIMDSINPYWIEQGTALRFTFVNEIRIRGQFSRLVLLFNGHVIQDFREKFYNPDTRLLEINRSFFEDNPKWLQPAPDSLAIDAPPPSVIKNRPTFN